MGQLKVFQLKIVARLRTTKYITTEDVTDGVTVMTSEAVSVPEIRLPVEWEHTQDDVAPTDKEEVVEELATLLSETSKKQEQITWEVSEKVQPSEEQVEEMTTVSVEAVIAPETKAVTQWDKPEDITTEEVTKEITVMASEAVSVPEKKDEIPWHGTEEVTMLKPDKPSTLTSEAVESVVMRTPLSWESSSDVHTEETTEIVQEVESAPLEATGTRELLPWESPREIETLEESVTVSEEQLAPLQTSEVTVPTMWEGQLDVVTTEREGHEAEEIHTTPLSIPTQQEVTLTVRPSELDHETVSGVTVAPLSEDVEVTVQVAGKPDITSHAEIQPVRKERTELEMAPEFVQELVDIEVHLGQPAELVCEVEGSPQPTVQWFRNGIEVTTSEQYTITTDIEKRRSTLLIASVTEEDDTEFECRATNIQGVVSSFAELIVDGKTLVFHKALKRGL